MCRCLTAEIERGRAAGITGEGPFRYGFFSRWFVGFMDAPPKMRVSAPKNYLPPPTAIKDKVVPEFLSIHQRILELMLKANGRGSGTDQGAESGGAVQDAAGAAVRVSGGA